MQIKVDSQIGSVLGTFIRGLAKRQLPYATANAINSTCFDIRDHTVKHTYPDSFEVRNKNFARAAFRVDKANKRRLVGRVYDRLQRRWLERQARGGTKRPHGSNLAIPTSNIKRTASGRVGVAKRPRNLRNAFVADLNGKGKAVYQRYGRKGRKLRLAYVLEPRARVGKRFSFYEDATTVTNKRFPKHFSRAFAHAVRTSKG
ncbi:hypothetical protein GO013_15600 [Pseudodesulfovibrio sp. JC047]|uniref:hypothetical protein n=1 Tax=Pseudodesulfovibrio sp. JC047 TaxID=2683199 RepID=UPI0013D02860|nr:hypothetical protein [Pseudodesulfovibrio sp. JC047]NDV20835.1 hypothetical protein [Pseudodesulfovibrio sp. JC047]